MSFMMPKMPPPPPPLPIAQQPQGAKAATTQASRMAAAGGALPGVATGPSGLTTPANTAQKTLLGG